MVVITDDRREIILGAVRRMYTELALHPDREFHFPTGRTACEFEGYDPALLDQVPAEALASFAGVNCPFRAGVIERGQVVLDVGSGSGTDALIASLLVGPEGEVIGLDMTAAMRERLERNARTLGASNVRALAGTAEEIPLPDASVDVVTTNGVLNLVPDKARAVAESARPEQATSSPSLSLNVVIRSSRWLHRAFTSAERRYGRQYGWNFHNASAILAIFVDLSLQ